MRGLDRRAFLERAAMLARVGCLRGLAAPAAAATVGLDAFLTLSTRLTGRNGLDRGLAETYLAALLAKPASAGLLADLAASATGAGAARTPAHAALEERILVAWYTGVHDNGGRAERATHAGALMWSALGRPAPGLCAGPPSSWAEAPPAARS